MREIHIGEKETDLSRGEVKWSISFVIGGFNITSSVEKERGNILTAGKGTPMQRRIFFIV